MTDQDRISKIERSIADLEQILHELKTEVKDIKQAETSPLPETVSALPENVPTQSAQAEQPVQAEQVTQAAMAEPSATSSSDAQKPAKHSATPSPDTQKPSAPSATPKKKRTSSFEENLGGKVMGIVAAVLVFVGLFLFG